jgi:hypothetical protein
MLFYLLDDSNKYSFLKGYDDHAVYVGQNNDLMLNRSDDEYVQSQGWGDESLTMATSIQNIFTALDNINYAECLVVVASDTQEFSIYPLTYAKVIDPFNNSTVLLDTPERMELRTFLVDCLNNPHFMYGI